LSPARWRHCRDGSRATQYGILARGYDDCLWAELRSGSSFNISKVRNGPKAGARRGRLYDSNAAIEVYTTSTLCRSCCTIGSPTRVDVLQTLAKAVGQFSTICTFTEPEKRPDSAYQVSESMTFEGSDECHTCRI
jgi:hypothetical protein